jgi:hypothetical protein
LRQALEALEEKVGEELFISPLHLYSRTASEACPHESTSYLNRIGFKETHSAKKNGVLFFNPHF